MALHDLLDILAAFLEEAFVEVLDGRPRFLGTTDPVSSWPPGKCGVCFGAAKAWDKMFCDVTAWFKWLDVDLSP